MSMPSDSIPKMGLHYFCHFPGCKVPLANAEKKWCQRHKKVVNHCSPAFAQEHELIKFGHSKARNKPGPKIRHSSSYLICIPLTEVWHNKKCPRCGHSLSGPFNVLDPHSETISLDCILCGFHSFLSRPRSFDSPDRDQEAKVG